MHDADDDMVIALDALSGEVILALPGHPYFLPDVEAYVNLLDKLYSAVPRLRAAQDAALGSGERSHNRPSGELANWSVIVQKRLLDLDDEEEVERIAAATGWSRSRTGREIGKGYPVVLASNLTLVDALNLQLAAELNGVTAKIAATVTE